MEDPNGMERLTGESDEQYIARQTRIREEAKARMAAKFGGSGGMAGRMGGVGSSSGYGSSGSYTGSGGGLVDVDSLKNSLVSGFGSVFSSVSSLTVQASQQATAVFSDTSRSSVTDVWSSLTSAASRAAAAMTEPDNDGGDGLAALQRKIREEKELRGNSSAGNNQTANRYSGFGSEEAFNQGGFSSYNRQSSSNNSIDVSSVTSSMRTLGGSMSSSSSIATNFSTQVPTSAPSSFGGKGASQNSNRVTTSAPNSGTLKSGAKKLPAGDDFFASFGT